MYVPRRSLGDVACGSFMQALSLCSIGHWDCIRLNTPNFCPKEGQVLLFGAKKMAIWYTYLAPSKDHNTCTQPLPDGCDSLGLCLKEASITCNVGYWEWNRLHTLHLCQIKGRFCYWGQKSEWFMAHCLIHRFTIHAPSRSTYDYECWSSFISCLM